MRPIAKAHSLTDDAAAAAAAAAKQAKTVLLPMGGLAVHLLESSQHVSARNGAVS
jgi:hypothetical protein